MLILALCFIPGAAGRSHREMGSEFLASIADIQDDMANDLDSFLVGALTPSAISTGLLGDPNAELSHRLTRLEINNQVSKCSKAEVALAPCSDLISTLSDEKELSVDSKSAKSRRCHAECQAVVEAFVKSCKYASLENKDALKPLLSECGVKPNRPVGTNSPAEGTNSTSSSATDQVICDTKHNMYKWAAVLLNLILLVVAGMPLCFAGYRLFKPALFLFGFGTCFMLVYQLIIFHNFHGEKEWVAPLCATIGGLIGGIVSVGMWQVGLFLVGFALGGFSVVAVLMIVAQASADATKYLHDHAWLALTMVVLAGCIFGALTIQFEKPLIIIATALEGSWIIFQAVDYFVENTGFDTGQTVRLIVQFIPRNSQLVTPWHAGMSSCWIVNVCFSIWPTLFLLGLCVQTFITGNNFDHRAGLPGAKPDLKPKSYDAQNGYAV